MKQLPQYHSTAGKQYSRNAFFKQKQMSYSIITFVAQHTNIWTSMTTTFPTSSLVSPKISPCSPGSRWMAFGLQRAKVLG